MKEKENVNLFESFFIFGVEKNDVINVKYIKIALKSK